MSNTVKIGLVGLGRAGDGMHVTALKERTDMFTVVAACDLIEDRLEKVKAATGWKVETVEWESSETGERYAFRNYRNAPASVSLPIPAMKKDNRYRVYMDFLNTKTGAYLSIYYYLND